MEAARTSETSVGNYFTRQYIPEDNIPETSVGNYFTRQYISEYNIPDYGGSTYL
jgi:hypothetical protein